MSIAEKLQTIAENEQKVYDAGKKAEHDAFWDAYQDYGNRATYQYGFYHQGWTESNFKPKYDIVCVGNYTANSAFSYSLITEIPVTVDFSQCGTELTSTFLNCTQLKKIRKVVFAAKNTFYKTFFDCNALEEITVEGTIGNSVGFEYSHQLTHNSLMSIINALQSGVSSKTLTLGSTNLAKLTDTEKAIATEKGWTLA